MFIWDFALDKVMDQLIDWLYGQIVGFLGNFFSQMGNMGVELFDMSWVKSIVLFFLLAKQPHGGDHRLRSELRRYGEVHDCRA